MVAKKTDSQLVEKIFEDDEMVHQSINPAWTKDQLLSTDGVFYLKDVVAFLGISSRPIKQEAKRLKSLKLSPWQEIGVRKAWTHWLVRMRTFKPHLENNPFLNQKIFDPDWDLNQMLSQKGIFLLKDVAPKAPFTAQSLRYMVRKHKNPREQFGIWQDPTFKTYLVDMEKFAEWLLASWGK